MFLDEAIITVRGGSGGRGCVSWRREKFVPKGGPDGGDGGDGGNVYLIANENTDTLSDFASKKKFEAEKGRFGMGQNKCGKSGEDLYLKIPPGTLVFEGEDTLVADLKNSGDQILVARGGRGGYGNAHFKSATRQRPDFAELGEPGEEKQITLELKLVADIGIVGFPNAGKSTLISVISAARPKIADYPFTTLIPNLGVVSVSERSYVVCDVPGLIEGASDGKGLGHQFLRHVERCGILIHMLDISRTFDHGEPDPQKLRDDYRILRKELERYSPILGKKHEIVVLNKIDLISSDQLSMISDHLEKEGIKIFAVISAATKRGTNELAKKLLPLVLEERKKQTTVLENAEPIIPVLQPHITANVMGAYRIEQPNDETIIVRGKRLEQFAVMTDFASKGAIRRFIDVIERIGLRRALKKYCGSTEMKKMPKVFIGKVSIGGYL